MKLKTLKDFGDVTTEGVCYYTYEELKAEAVKWTKMLSKDGIQENVCIWKWIKHFFNLTEEELK